MDSWKLGESEILGRLVDEDKPFKQYYPCLYNILFDRNIPVSEELSLVVIWTYVILLKKCALQLKFQIVRTQLDGL